MTRLQKDYRLMEYFAICRINAEIAKSASMHKLEIGKAFEEFRFNHLRLFNPGDIVRGKVVWKEIVGKVEQYQDGEVLIKCTVNTEDGSPSAVWVQFAERKLEIVERRQ